jgi:elongator complex protein 3
MLSDDLRCDQIKIYPHLSMPGTLTKEWLDSGKYKSWVDEDKEGFNELMIDFISKIDETTRIVRVQRDLPQKSLNTPNGYTNDQPSNLEELITRKIYAVGKTREDIRYHEPGFRFPNINDIKYYVDIKEFKEKIDIFISAQSYVCNDVKKKISDFRVVWGYCRLRIIDYNNPTNDNLKVIKFFKNNIRYGRIRELKVNGSTQSIGTRGKSAQHQGIGTNLLKIAEEMAYKFNMTHVTVTSAVGVRDYYRLKHGYILDDCGLMWKKLNDTKLFKLVEIINNDTKYEIVFENYKNNNIIKYIIPTTIFVSLTFITFSFYRYKIYKFFI